MKKFIYLAVYCILPIIYLFLSDSILKKQKLLYSETFKSGAYFVLLIVLPIMLGILLGMENLIAKVKRKGALQIDIIRLIFVILIAIVPISLPLAYLGVKVPNVTADILGTNYSLYGYCIIVGYLMTTIVKKTEA